MVGARGRGFTLIELLIVLAIVATLLAVVAPKYFHSVDKANEVALRTDLRILRDAVDKYYADKGQYPPELKSLAEARYVRAIPIDPITGSVDTWRVTPHPDGITQGIYDVHSGAEGFSADGSPFAEW